MDGGHPSTGSYDFRPVLDTLRRRGYPGWVSLEAFNFKPGAETIANESIQYLESQISKLPS
jgi:sugar phosphate isomerase/epimerase